MVSTATRPVTIPFRCPQKNTPVWILSDVNDWQPQEMKHTNDSYEHTFEIAKDRHEIFYKFRIGDWDYANDTEAPSVPDGFGGINNRYEVPPAPEPVVEIVPLLEEQPKPAAPVKSRQADLEDEAYHSSDSATPKASRAASISSQQGIESVSSASEILPLTEDTSAKVDQAVENATEKVETNIVQPVKEAVADVSASTQKEAAKVDTNTQKPTVRMKKNNQELPLYLGLAAITVAVVAYFLRIVESFIPIDERRQARGPVTKAMKSVIVMLLAVATAAQRAVESRRR